MLLFLVLMTLLLRLETVESEDCKSQVDIVFLVDTSDSVGPSNFKAAKTLMEKFVAGFTIGKHYAQIGVDTFDDTFKSEFQLKTYTKKSKILSAIRKIKYRGRGTDMVKAFDKVRTISFSNTAGARVEATKVAIILTDGRSYNTKATSTAATNWKKLGIIPYAIGIGQNVLQSEIDDIASDPKRKFSFTSKTRSESVKLAKDLIIHVCKVSHGPFHTGYVGCFRNRSGISQRTTTSSMMTPQICINYCRLRSFIYANILGGNTCDCSQNMPEDLRQATEKCNVRCHGDKNIICGGVKTVAAYKTGYIGCFTDTGNRVLPDMHFHDGKMTPEYCIAVCKDHSYRYAGVQYSRHCFCGDDNSRGSKRPQSECNMACSGDNRRKCGGTWRNDVFETGTNFIGCFEERSSGILNKQSISIPRMSNDMCAAWCRQQGYMYAGTKQGSHCSCGNEFHENHEKRKKRSECNQNCKGNSNQKCGGTSRISIFKTEINF